MKKRAYKYFVGDFETTVYENQKHTEVWASGLCELYTENAIIHTSLLDHFEYLISLKENVIVYFHNLKFDGSFWLPFLLHTMGYTQAYKKLNEEGTSVKWLNGKDMKENTFKYSISDMGQWYNIIIKVKGKFIEIRDSLKILPFSLARIGQSFKTKHQKLEMDYKGFRYSGCNISEQEKEYLKNDLFVIKEALEIMFNEGHVKLTIGSCCLAEFKKLIGKDDYETFFPDIFNLPIKELDNQLTYGKYIRKSYKGGWCYIVDGANGKLFSNGVTYDVNSLYPSMMHSESGNRYPVGQPHYFKKYIPDIALESNKYYFIRVKTRFYLKPGYLPFIQIKNNLLYKGTECLKTSDVCDKNGVHHKYLFGSDGTLKPTTVELTLTMTDWVLIQEHYDLVDCEIIDGVWFFSALGIFDSYINKYKEKKINSKGALKELAKLFLNNLYGKLSSNDDSSFKIAYLKDDGSIGFTTISEHDKKPGYIPCGSAITSYARNFTIRGAQKNYHGDDKQGFKYGDTDSIHCDITEDKIIGLKIDDNAFNCWKHESTWDAAVFTRQKTYIEHVTHENKEKVEPYYNIKCAGMPKKCKDLFELSISDLTENELNDKIKDMKLCDEDLEFVKEKRTLLDFNLGLLVPGKLRPKRIKGGLILVDTTYKMR